MFKNLTDLPLMVLDIIPDLIAQNPDPAVKAELQEKEITFEAFEIEDVCPTPDLAAGDRLKQDNKAQTVGDVLCERAYTLYNYESPPKFWFTALVEIGAYHSYCGLKWQEVQTGGKHLTLDQKLCCVRKGTTVKYRPCNGSRRTVKEC